MAAVMRCVKYHHPRTIPEPKLLLSALRNGHTRSFSSATAFRRRPCCPLTARRQTFRDLRLSRTISSSTLPAPEAMEQTSENPRQCSGPAVSIRPATVADAKDIAELGSRVFSITFGHSVEPHELQAFLDESYSVEAVTRDLEDPNRDTILATDRAGGSGSDSGGILGFAMLTRGSSEPCVAQLESTVELQRIYLDPRAHGTGTGKMLADRLEDMAREQGFRNIWLGVWEENLRAKRAYEKWGYRAVGSHDFVVGSVVQTDDILAKRL